MDTGNVPATVPAAEPPSRPNMAVSSKGITITSFEELGRFADMVCQSGIVPRGTKAADVMVKVQMGLELGFSPIQSLTAIYVVNSRPALEALPMKALIDTSGLMQDFEVEVRGEGDERHGWCMVHRQGRKKPLERTFSMAQAKQAGLLAKDGPWRTYPDDMLQYRAMSRAFKIEFPDVLKGITSPGEAAEEPKPKTVVPDYTVRQETPLAESKAEIFDLPGEALTDMDRAAAGLPLADPVPVEPEDRASLAMAAGQAPAAPPVPEGTGKDMRLVLLEEIDRLRNVYQRRRLGDESSLLPMPLSDMTLVDLEATRAGFRDAITHAGVDPDA